MSHLTVLANIPSPSQGVWHLGPLPLRAYALCIIIGIVVAVWWGDRRWQARGGRSGEVLDVALWAVPFGLIGGRLYHLATDWNTYFGDGPKTPMDAIKIWDGGLGIWGAVLLGAVGAWIGTRFNKIKLPAFGDAIAPAILLAQAIGRLGNWFNQELYGRPTDLPWGLEIYERVDSEGRAGPSLINGVSNGQVLQVVQPTFLYELLWNVAVVVLLVLIDRKFRIGHGRLFAMYVAGYSFGRFFVEMLRDDHATLVLGIRINLFTAALVFILAAVYVLVAPKGRDESVYRGRPDADADADADDDDVDDEGDATDDETSEDSWGTGAVTAGATAVGAGVALGGGAAVATARASESATDDADTADAPADEPSADDTAATEAEVQSEPESSEPELAPADEAPADDETADDIAPVEGEPEPEPTIVDTPAEESAVEEATVEETSVDDEAEPEAATDDVEETAEPTTAESTTDESTAEDEPLAEDETEEAEPTEEADETEEVTAEDAAGADVTGESDEQDDLAEDDIAVKSEPVEGQWGFIRGKKSQ